MNNEGYIYVLQNPITQDIRYVGQSIDVKSRLRKHKSVSIKFNNKLGAWLKSIKKIGLSPELVVIDSCVESELDFWERHYISVYKSWGFNLTNSTLGGFRNKTLSKESKQKISDRLKGTKQSEETKLKRKDSLKKAWQSSELRELKRIQTTELNKKGLIGTKGKPSNKKGIPLIEKQKADISSSLKKYYETNHVWNKVELTSEQVSEILNIVKQTSKFNAHKKLGYSRSIIERIYNENNKN